MTTYYLPDLTGTNPDYLQVNMPVYIYQTGQKVIFENSPVFSNSLQLTLTDGTSIPLVRGTDWEVQTDDIDESAMSRAFLENHGFTGELVKSVTIISTLGLYKVIAATYQEFYLTIPGRTFDDGTPFEVSVDLIKSLVTGLADTRQQIARVQSPIVSDPSPPKLLPFDINCERSSNIITNETITINTIAGAKVVRLVQGAFFADSLTLSLNGTPLNPETDYLPVVVSPLTERSLNKSGIYQYILLNGSFTGTLTASYHAVGGEVQLNDINAIYELLMAIKTYLNDGIFITSETVTETPAFRAFHARLNLLEDGMRRLLDGTPTYGDTSSGTAVTRPISTTDADFHWWTIASLYQVQGSSSIIRADQFKGRVYLPGSKISVSFTVDLNIDQERNQVSFTTDSVVFDPKYKLFSDLDISAQQFPLIRVVWNQTAGVFSGAHIQFGVPLPTLADMMVVEDMSTPESCWILSRLNEFVTGETVSPTAPSDNGFLLPDGVSIWASASSASYQSVYVPEFKDGYLAYAGSNVTTNQIITVGNTGSMFNILLPNYFPVDKAKYLTVTMASADSSTIYELDIPLTGVQSLERVGRMTFTDSDDEAMSMSATITKDVLNDISVSLNVSEIAPPLATGIPSSKTDVVRYMRVKV